MSRKTRYVFYSLIFVFAVIGLALHQPFVTLFMLLVGIALGMLTDRIDNLRDEPFKKYNVKHHHYEGPHSRS
ncbi:hypothetical protein [Ferroacidibacillus organovorans]|uniref:Uncharacterized protein n=1 Tax=Ferroacidibacillus organovorans TaxID=1765683 RepID=A0A162RZJ6_9BACL|nr:hypothetical protein [Ferroacidibacillus organovorans]KYP79391.1 hypothetical protein AYJ22_14790 [Ferroacidibacillus organovorans]OAG90655.1 hypothetical protein AYW79_14120 [Ferroacidibacillus organovorans]OPG16249.1 hypothetical protein B2M26_08030 [Ferroacidibacillus organovorans]